MTRFYKALLALSIVFTANVCKAQIIVPDQTIKSSSVTFVTKSISKDSFVVVDTENGLFKETPALAKFPAVSFAKRNHSILQAFTMVFSKARIMALKSELTMGLNYYINPQTGRVKEVTFLLRKNTEITAAELQDLEFSLLRLVIFKVTPQLKENKGMIILTQNVLYRRIEDGTIDL